MRYIRKLNFEIWLRNSFLTAILIFMIAPIILVMINSFNASTLNIWPPTGWSLQWYEKLVHNQGFRIGLTNSLMIAAFSTLLTLAVSIPASFALARYQFWGRGMFEAAFKSPVVVPRVVIGFALFVLFIAIKLPAFGNWHGITVAHALLSMPIAISILAASMVNIDHYLSEAARDLGAGRLQAFRLVVLPQIYPAIVFAGGFSFITSFDEVEATLFLVTPSIKTLPLEMFHYLEFQQDPLIAAVSTLLIVATLLVVLLALALGMLRKNP